MAAKKRTPSKKKHAERALPLRRVTVPDTRLASVRREIRRQARRVAAKHDAESDIDDFIERLYADTGSE